METNENKIKKYAYYAFLRADAHRKKEPFLMGEKIIEKKDVNDHESINR